MKLTDLITPATIAVPLASKDKNAAIAELVNLLVPTGKLADPKALLDSVLQREAVRSTGIGNGLAIPHGKSPACKEIVMAIGKPAEPIPFAAIDNKPVWMIVLLGTPPEQNGLHIQALARISRIMMVEKNRAALHAAADAQGLFNALLEAEKL